MLKQLLKWLFPELVKEVATWLLNKRTKAEYIEDTRIIEELKELKLQIHKTLVHESDKPTENSDKI